MTNGNLTITVYHPTGQVQRRDKLSQVSPSVKWDQQGHVSPLLPLNRIAGTFHLTEHLHLVHGDKRATALLNIRSSTISKGTNCSFPYTSPYNTFFPGVPGNFPWHLIVWVKIHDMPEKITCKNRITIIGLDNWHSSSFTLPVFAGSMRNMGESLCPKKEHGWKDGRHVGNSQRLPETQITWKLCSIVTKIMLLEKIKINVSSPPSNLSSPFASPPSKHFLDFLN